MAPTRCFFASDLHGHADRYEKLLAALLAELPDALFLGGDLLPHGSGRRSGVRPSDSFVGGFLAPRFRELRDRLGGRAPRVFLVLGNDDPRSAVAEIEELATDGLWEHVHARRVGFAGGEVLGYACIPPSPFLLKDWERYDVSRYVDPGCVSPEEGFRTVPEDASVTRHATIARDLETLAGGADLSGAICLFHAPPHGGDLDRAALDGLLVDRVPLDPHVGSIAIGRFIKERAPLVTLHGHVHESARLTGSWRDRIGRTHAFSAAHDGPELALVRFALDDLDHATRELL